MNLRSIYASLFVACSALVAFQPRVDAGLPDPQDVDHTGVQRFIGPVYFGASETNRPMTNTAERLNQAGVDAFKPRFDTNSTTTATAYMPTRRGDILFGRTGGTQTMWVCATTNDGTPASTNWVQTTNDWLAYSMPFPAGSVASALATFGQLAVQTNGNVAGSLVVSNTVTAGAAEISGLVTHASSGTISVTNAQALTFSARWTAISSATAVTNLLLGAPAAAGDLVTVENVGTNSITITPVSNFVSTNNIVLGGRRCNATLHAQTSTNWTQGGPVWCN